MSDFYAGRRILVTGGLGFIGSNLVHELVRQGAVVTILDAKVPNTGWNYFNLKPIRKHINLVIAPLHAWRVRPLVTNSDIVFHLAGVLSHIDALENPLHDLQINTVQQLQFLETCRRVNPEVKIVYTGTRNQYGRALRLPVDEDHPFDPIDTNGVSEIAAEHYFRLYQRLYGIRSTTLRLCNVFGPRHQMRHPRQGVLNWFLRLLLEDQTVPLMGGGTQVRDCAYVDDVVRALLALGSSEAVWGEAFNIGAYPVSLRGFVETAIEQLGRGKWKEIGFPSERKLIEPGDYVADYSKLAKTLGWEPTLTLAEAINKTLDFYQQHRKHYWEVNNDTGL